MTDTNHNLWQTKVAARLHDPAEKALVLLRDPAGHDNGTSHALGRLLGFHDFDTETLDPDNDEALVRTVFRQGIPSAMYRQVQHADWWAAAADRPQWPMEAITVSTTQGEKKTFEPASWAQVCWTKKPVLIHPLTADKYDLGQLDDPSGTDFHDIKERSFKHLSSLISALHKQNPDEQDWRKLLLTLWRFAPELREADDDGKLGALWRLLPADTRIPDHSIWDHLDLTSAFAGAFTADPNGEAALLTLSIGPVQPFIAAARKMEDLWAGSHLLARLSWEAMKPVCEQLGPDAILFPRLRGVPQVDLWLRDDCQLPAELFKDCDWNKGSTDSNPLFAAALPNRFVAVVPASQAEALARQVQTRVRSWLQDLGMEVVIALLRQAGYEDDPESIATPFEQMKKQLAGFPEVHWAAVPFSLIGIGNQERQTELDTAQLSEAMRPFFAGSAEPGFLASSAWQLLQKELQLDHAGKKSTFLTPTPGVLYPAVHELAERALAAAKTVRPFTQNGQQGWRCSLSGETEWLTTDAEQLHWNQHYRQQQGTLWTKIAAKKPAWAKKGEHLGALPAIKRLWPTLFAEEVGQALGKPDIGRFIVSTHTMALAHQLDQWLEHSGITAPGTQAALDRAAPVALPRRLMLRHRNHPALKDARRLPSLLDAADDSDSESDQQSAEHLIRQTLANAHGKQTQDLRLETYYSLLMMDGDRMGAWLSGGDDYAISYRNSFHPQLQKDFDAHAGRQAQIQDYGQQKRALSPNRHLAISGALNDFSLSVVRHVVENEHLGRLIYAGGDDVFAMLPVADLLPAMQRLRQVYSGLAPEDQDKTWGDLQKNRNSLHCKNGFAWLNGKLMRMMGSKATASCGAVIAHHQAPLSAVRRELAAAEQRAKNEGGRDAFSITVVKRSGGTLRLTAKWAIKNAANGATTERPAILLDAWRKFFTDPSVSRRAAYHTLQWLDDKQLPELNAASQDMLQQLLAYQLERQSDKAAQQIHRPVALAQRLIELALCQHNSRPGQRIGWLRNFISVAEFLAREVRANVGETA